MFSGGWLWSVVLDKRRQHLPARVLPQGCLRQVYTYVTPFYLCYLSTYVTLFYLSYPFLSSFCVCVVCNREVGWDVSGHGQLCVRTALCLIPSPGCLPLSFLCVSPSPPPILHPIPLLIHRNDCSEASESSNSMPPSGSGAGAGGGGGGSKKLSENSCAQALSAAIEQALLEMSVLFSKNAQVLSLALTHSLALSLSRARSLSLSLSLYVYACV